MLCKCIMSMSCAHKGQKRTLDALELEGQVTVSHPVVAENQTQFLFTSSSLVPDFEFFFKMCLCVNMWCMCV